MPIDIQNLFRNQIFSPTFQFLQDITRLPLALDPESNSLMHSFEGLILHVHHFYEKNGRNMKADETLGAIANSIKHPRRKQLAHTLHTACRWEHLSNEFRFLTMTIVAQRGEEKSDVIDHVIERVNYMAEKLGASVPKLQRQWASYEFFDWAFMYEAPFISSGATSVRIQLVQKSENGDYAPVALESIRVVVLPEVSVGKDPKPYFPIQE
jgi:hypothetical protein